MSDLKTKLKRLERLFQIRETVVSVAETNVRQAEGDVRKFETADTKVVVDIQDAQAGIAYLQTATGQDLQGGEKYIHALQLQRKSIKQSLEKATGNLEERRREWTEAMRERKIIEKMQARRLHQWERENDVAQQKSQDDASVGRYVRTRIQNSQSVPDANQRLNELDRPDRPDTDRT